MTDPNLSAVALWRRLSDWWGNLFVPPAPRRHYPITSSLYANDIVAAYLKPSGMSPAEYQHEQDMAAAGEYNKLPLFCPTCRRPS